MLEFLLAAAVDVTVALGLSGCVYALLRAMERRPSFVRIVAWTAFLMFAIATRGELRIAASGPARPDVGQVIPLLLLVVAAYRLGWRSTSGEIDPEIEAAVAAEHEIAGAQPAR